MAQPVLGVFSWLTWVLLPRESWYWFIPHHGTTWLYLFPYKHLRCSTSEILKGNVHSHRLARRHPVIGYFFCPAQTNGRAVSLRDYKKASVEEEKIVFPIQASSTQYSFHISGKPGYDSNQVRYFSFKKLVCSQLMPRAALPSRIAFKRWKHTSLAIGHSN